MSKELTVKDDNKALAQGNNYSSEQVKLIKNIYAKGTTDDELKLLLYTADKWELDVLAKQIWCVKFGSAAAQIYAGRDGFLEIAHRSGVFNGMESGTTGDVKSKNLKGWCKVFRKDMEHPFCVEVDFDEYSTGKSLWQSKPKTMIQKVSESQALRKAFSITGMYCPEEMAMWEEESKGKHPTKPTEPKIEMMDKAQKANIWTTAQEKLMTLEDLQRYCVEQEKTELSKLTFKQATDILDKLSKLKVNIEPIEEITTDFTDTPFEEVKE